MSDDLLWLSTFPMKYPRRYQYKTYIQYAQARREWRKENKERMKKNEQGN